MRMLLKVSVPVEAGNAAIDSGAMQQTIQTLVDKLDPEATYFFPDENGNRSSLFIFDMTDSAQLPPILEPVFHSLGGSVHVTPVMNAEDLQRGLAEAAG